MLASLRLATKNLQVKMLQSALRAITPSIFTLTPISNKQPALLQRTTTQREQFWAHNAVTITCNPKLAAAAAAATLMSPNAPSLRQCIVADINGYDDDMMHEDKLEKLQKRSVSCDANPSPSVPMIPLQQIPPPPPTIVDIDGFTDKMMYEDLPQIKEIPFNNNSQLVPIGEKEIEPESQIDVNKVEPKKSSMGQVSLAPVDIIDPWEDELHAKQGTVDIDAFEELRAPELPPIPTVRNNVYEFKGIKVILPKRMLQTGTYRYCLDPTDKYRPDDIRVCTYDK